MMKRQEMPHKQPPMHCDARRRRGSCRFVAHVSIRPT